MTEKPSDRVKKQNDESPSDAAEDAGTKLRDGEKRPTERAPDGAVSPDDLNAENDGGAG